MGPASHTKDVSCSDTPNVNKKGVPYLPAKSASTPIIQRRKRWSFSRGKPEVLEHLPELNGPSDLRTGHRYGQVYQILRRQAPLRRRGHESLDARDGGLRLQLPSFKLSLSSRGIRFEAMRAGGVATTGRPGHLCCWVRVGVGVGSKGHDPGSQVEGEFPLVAFRVVEGEGGVNESPVCDLGG